MREKEKRKVNQLDVKRGKISEYIDKISEMEDQSVRNMISRLKKQEKWHEYLAARAAYDIHKLNKMGVLL